MRQTEKPESWVVYLMTVNGKPGGGRAVCDQRQWEAMECARPGYHTLLVAGIATEAEAERAARSDPADGDTGKPGEPKAPPAMSG
jgi:hypothetical protein